LRLPPGIATLWVVAVAFTIVVGILAALARSWSAPILVVAVLLLAIYCIRAQGVGVGLVTTLIVASVADHFTFSVGQLALRAEQVAALIALVVLLAIRLRERDGRSLKPSLPEVLLAAWFAVGLASSLLASPNKGLSAKVLILIAICALGFLMPRQLLAGPRSREHMETVVVWLLLVFATEALYGTLAYLLHVFGPTIAITPNPASGHLSAYGTLWEQNVFGAFAAAGAVAWVYLGPVRFRWAAIGLAACLGGLFDSLTRAAWLAAVVVGAIGLALPGLRRRIDLREVGIGAMGGLIVVAATLVVDRITSYNVLIPSGKGGGGQSGGLIASLLNVVDLFGRVIQTAPVWDDIKGNLLLGRGIASYQALHQVNGVQQHVASLPLLILHDTGVIGLLVFAGFVVAVVLRVWPKRSDPVVSALGQVGIIIGLTNLATETTELMIGWLLIGILMAAVDVAPAGAAEDGSEKLTARSG
jgi:hypothetical protein